MSRDGGLFVWPLIRADQCQGEDTGHCDRPVFNFQLVVPSCCWPPASKLGPTLHLRSGQDWSVGPAAAAGAAAGTLLHPVIRGNIQPTLERETDLSRILKSYNNDDH